MTTLSPKPTVTREQRAWFFYDWANSGYWTTTATVLFSPYLTSVAEQAACGYAGTTDRPCREDVDVLGFLSLSAGSLVFYVITFTTLLSAVLLPIVGVLADRTASKRKLLAGIGWTGSVFAAAMFLVTGSSWELGALLLIGANLCFASSIVVYDAILVDIAPPDDRDRISSRGWALGYLGGAILLAVNLAVVTMHDALGMTTQEAVRVSMLSAAIWWAGFTIIPFRGLKDHPPRAVVDPEAGTATVRGSFVQLWTTLRGLRAYPQTMLFLAAYLFFNDGIQTVISASSVYGEKELGFDTNVLMATILLVQFVAFGGALLFGRVAARIGARRTILGGLAVWILIVCAGYVLPAGQIVPFLVMAAGIGLVMGGTQALSRSFFSQLIPPGREAEYFSLYQACERGTSWFGTLVFAVVHQMTGSYRPAILALIVFFVVGGALLLKVDPRRGVREAGNAEPAVL